MSEPRKHHYIPQSYLEGFQFETKHKYPKIAVYYKKRLLSKPKFVSIKDAACQRDLHTVKTATGEDRTSVETILSNIEGKSIKNIRDIINRQCIDDNSKLHLAITILLMKARVPQNLKALHNAIESNLKTVAEGTFKENPLGLKGNLSDHFKLTLNNNIVMHYMLKSALGDNHIKILYRFNFSLLKAPKEHYFLCSDAPVSYFCPNHDGVHGAGISTPGLEIFMPLDKNYGVLCSCNNLESFKEISIDELNEFNRRTVVTAEDYIFSSIEDKSITHLIGRNKKVFSGVRFFETNFMDGTLQVTQFIPVTNAK